MGAASRSSSRRRSRCGSGVEHASQHGTSSAILVESFLTGFDHRMLVVDGHLVAVAKRVPGHVVGDGEHTIAQLVEIVNQDPQPGRGAREGADPTAVRRPGRAPASEGGATTAETVLAPGRDVLPPVDGQPLDGRHGHRPDRRRPPGQPRHGRPRRPRRRARRGRRGLPDRRRVPVVARDRRGHRRGQRGAGLPHARGALGGHAARRGRAGDGHAVPARHDGAHPRRDGDGDQRQDHDHPDGGQHPADGRRRARA